MAISFASAPGNVYNCLGKCGLLLKAVRTHQLAQYTNMTDTVTGVVAQLASESDLQALMGSAYIGILGGVESACSTAQNLAVQVINRKVFRDNPQFGQTLTSINTLASITEVIRQMKLAGATVQAMTVTATVQPQSPPGPHFFGTGNGIINVSTKRASDGLVLENSFSEDLTFSCSEDSYTGNTTAGNETFTITGQGQEGDVFAFDWPLGSNCSLGVSAIDGASDNSNGNILTNSGFDAWTANVPDNWTLSVGTAGTNIAQETGITYDGGSCLALIGDVSGTLTAWTQLFDDDSGTSGTIEPLTQYSFCMFLRRDGVAAASGQLAIELIDSGGAILKDANGVNNQTLINLTALTTVFTGYVATFRTPEIMPSSALIRMRLTAGNALTNGRTVYLDRSSQGLFSQCYTSGPSVAIHSGSIPFVQGDRGVVTISTTVGSGTAASLNFFQVLTNRCFGMQQLDLLLPSSATPSINDAALIA